MNDETETDETAETPLQPVSYRVSHRSLIGNWLLVGAGIAGALASPMLEVSAGQQAAAFYSSLFVGGLSFGVIGYMRLAYRFVLDGDRVWARHGLLWQQNDQMSYRDVRATTVNRTPLGLLMGYGTLEFAASGTEGSEVRFLRVADPEGVKQVANSRMNEATKG